MRCPIIDILIEVDKHCEYTMHVKKITTFVMHI